MMRSVRAGLLAVLVFLMPAPGALAQDAPPAGAPEAQRSWEVSFWGALYLQPGDDNFLQPTLRADHGRWHFETRYNYEARQSASFFAGTKLLLGEKVKVELTPLIGGMVGDTHGVVPAVQVDLTAGPFNAYVETEYVLSLGDASSYLYNWSEFSLTPGHGLRAGLVTQMTRVQHEPNDFQAGLLVGLTYKKLDGTVYLFEPGGADHSTVISLGITF